MLKTKQHKGFTLIEILIVLAVIGIVASIILIMITSSKDRSKVAKGLKYSDSVRAQLSSYEVAFWKFEESSCPGSCIKDSWNGNNGTPYNMTASQFGQSGVGGGKAVRFDGTNSFVLTTLNSSTGYLYADDLVPNIKWTTSVWFRHSGGASISTQQIIMGASGGTGAAATYAVWVTDTGMLQAKFRGGVGGADTTIATGVSDDKWHLVIIIWNGSQVKGYFDDKSPIIITPGTAGNQGNWLTIGDTANGTAGLRFNGLIDEVQIWSSALTAMDVQRIYAESAPRHGIALK